MNKRKMPKKPETKASPAFWCTITATINDVTAKLHHGKNNGAAWPSSAVSKIATKNFMLGYDLLKVIFPFRLVCFCKVSLSVKSNL